MSKAAIDHLVASHAAFGPLIERIGPMRLEVERREPYEALIRSIAHQQLHGNAARAILARFAALFPQAGFPTPEQVAAIDDPALRACGFSATKISAIRDICAKRLDGTVPTARQAAKLDDAALIARLVTIRGVGRWTVEMMLISALGRPDVLPVDDFGVREGWRAMNGLEAQPKPKALAEIGTAWAPFRTTAAWYLWRASDETKRIKQSM
jgi:DNA-3-methyladenine glycosylase II